MKIVITGSSGLIGSALISLLEAEGHGAVGLVRSKSAPKAGTLFWNPETDEIDRSGLEGIDAVVHLAGDPIIRGRWTPKKKASILNSRVHGTRFLAQTLTQLLRPPAVFACASAIGFYGNRGDEILREESGPGSGFLAQVGQEWEKAAQSAAQRGIRVVNLRFGIVLSTRGGALSMMLPPFLCGVGGRLGNGRQYMSWISIEDVAGIILHSLTTDSLRGPVNVVAPHPVTNLEFTKTLGRVLRRPTIFPVPGLLMRCAFGELADEVLLASARVEPAKLTASGYRFRYPDLEGALWHLVTTSTRCASQNPGQRS